MYIIMFALVKVLERVQKLRCNDKIFLLVINRLSSACAMVRHANILCDGNRSKCQSQQWLVALNPTADTPLQMSVQIRG